MEDPNQVSEKCLPDTKFELVEKVNNHHLGNTELLPRLFQSFTERVLYRAESNCKLSMQRNLAHDGWY